MNLNTNNQQKLDNNIHLDKKEKNPNLTRDQKV